MSISAIDENAWDSILSIQAQVYTEVEPEKLAVLRAKWQHSPATCFVFKQDNVLAAYLLAHTWAYEAPPKLDALLPEDSHGSTVFIHDLAVARDFAGMGIGCKLVVHLTETALALGYRRMSLVAVQGSSAFWQKMGFTEVADVAVCPAYGQGAKVMQRVLLAC